MLRGGIFVFRYLTKFFLRRIVRIFAVPQGDNLFVAGSVQQLFNNQITDKCGCFTPALLRRRQDDV